MCRCLVSSNNLACADNVVGFAGLLHHASLGHLVYLHTAPSAAKTGTAAPAVPAHLLTQTLTHPQAHPPDHQNHTAAMT